MVRLVFRPYTQVGRPICTSGPLRTSTRVSSGFALPRHSSPSFGSYRARSCSTSPAVRARRAGGAPAPGFLRTRGRDPTSAGAPRPSPSLRQQGFAASPPTRARVRLLGPCFKTGRVGHRHRRRPLAGPFPSEEGIVGPPATAARRGRGALRTVRPVWTAAPGAGGPVLRPRKGNPASPAGPPRRGGARGRSGSGGGRGGDRLPRPRATATALAERGL